MRDGHADLPAAGPARARLRPCADRRRRRDRAVDAGLRGAGRPARSRTPTPRKGAQFAAGRGRLLRPLVHVGARARWSGWPWRWAGAPTSSTSSGLVCGAAQRASSSPLGHLELGGWAIAAGGVCDIMDGRIARATQRWTRKYGKFIDSTPRPLRARCSRSWASLCSCARRRPGPSIAAAAMAGSLLVSYTRARGESLGVLCKEGPHAARRAAGADCSWPACSTRAFARADRHAAGHVDAGLDPALIAAATFLTAVHRTWWIAVRLKSPE